MMKFDGAKMKQLREKAGLSQAALAEKMGKKQSVITLWERGGYAPKVANTLAIAVALGVNMADLFTDEQAVRPRAEEREEAAK